jgi:hypothetical protein
MKSSTVAHVRIGFWGSLQSLLATNKVQVFTALIETELARRGGNVECWLNLSQGTLVVEGRFRDGPVPVSKANQLQHALRRAPIAVAHWPSSSRYQSQSIRLLSLDDLAGESDDSDAELVMYD